MGLQRSLRRPVDENLFSIKSLVMILGGWHASTENTNKVERYDVTNDKWSFVASMNERRYRPGSKYIFDINKQ
jgi:hypothetical protein